MASLDAPTLAGPGRGAASTDAESAPVRRCAATRERGERTGMIRFVVDPEGRIVPDIAGRMPGRGIWVGAERDLVERARLKGGFARQARQKVEVDADIADRVEALLARRCLDLLGLGRRAGEVVAGFDRVEETLRSGRDGIIVTASDAAEGGWQKLLRLRRGRPNLAPFDRFELGRQLGRDEIVHVFWDAGRLAERFLAEVGRLRGFREFAFEPGDNAGRTSEGKS